LSNNVITKVITAAADIYHCLQNVLFVIVKISWW